MGVVEGVSAAEVSQLINTTGVDIILSDLLSSKTGGRLTRLLTSCSSIPVCKPTSWCKAVLIYLL